MPVRPEQAINITKEKRAVAVALTGAIDRTLKAAYRGGTAPLTYTCYAGRDHVQDMDSHVIIKAFIRLAYEEAGWEVDFIGSDNGTYVEIRMRAKYRTLIKSKDKYIDPITGKVVDPQTAGQHAVVDLDTGKTSAPALHRSPAKVLEEKRDELQSRVAELDLSEVRDSAPEPQEEKDVPLHQGHDQDDK
jgi:hypothetical protein